MQATALRLTALIAVVSGAAIAPATAQHAYDPKYPVCVERRWDGGFGRLGSSSPQCRYTSFAQCQYGLGPGESCMQNPFYQPPAKAARRSKRR